MIKGFTLGATDWTVVKIDKFERTTQLGLSSFGESKISLSKTWVNENVSKQIMEQTLYHEVVHAILDTMGRNELSQDEEFVQGFSVLIQQFEQTKK